MYDFKGFIGITALHDNANDQLSPIGELSAHSSSYARDKTYFERPNQQVELISFTSKKDDVRVTPTAAYTTHILDVAQWIYSNAINGTTTSDQEEFQRLLVGHFNNTMSKVFTGPMVVAKGNWFPSWITWVLDHDEDNTIEVYFSDNAFRNGYDDYEIIIVPPIEPVDTFQAVSKVVEDAMASFNLPTHNDKANKKAGGIPYTYMLSHIYTWHDREDETSTMPTDWSVLIWGAAGANPSNIKQAYRDQILSASGHPVQDWIKVFPEIFTTTQFTFVPGWTIRGIPNLEEEGALYSPILPYDFVVDAAGHFLDVANPTTDPQKILDSTQEVTTLPTLYKSLNTVSVAGTENREGMRSLYEIIPYYPLISSSSPDIGRIPKDTLVWMRMFINTLIAAEEYHPSAPTHEITRMIDNFNPDIEYFVFEHNNIEFRVVTRASIWKDAATED